MHASAIMRTLGKIIEGMDHLEDVAPLLARLGRSHAAVGIRPEHFAAMRACMMEALAEHLGRDAFAGAVEAAWGAFFDAITSVLIGSFPESSGVAPPEELEAERDFGL